MKLASNPLTRLSRVIWNTCRSRKSPLRAAAVTLYIGEAESPGDMRMVYSSGLFHPQSMYGILSRHRVQRYCTETSPNTVTGFHYRAYDTEQLFTDGQTRRVRLNRDRAFWAKSLATRECFSGRLRKIWLTRGVPTALIFIDFANTLISDGIQNDPNVVDALIKLSLQVEEFCKTYASSDESKDISRSRILSKDVCSRIMFDSRDFDFYNMKRLERDNVFARLIEDTLRTFLPDYTYRWGMFDADASDLDGYGIAATPVLQLSRSNPGADSPQYFPTLLDVGKRDSLEAWVYHCDCPVLLPAYSGINRYDDNLSRLFRESYLATTHHSEGYVFVPFTSGTRTFAVVAIAVGKRRDGHLGSVSTIHLATVLRSLWQNGRQVSQAWRHSIEERKSRFCGELLTIMDQYVSKDGNRDPFKYHDAQLRKLLASEFEADDCRLWKWVFDDSGGRFTSISDSSPNDSDEPGPRPNKWTYRVYVSGNPLLMLRRSLESRPDVFAWNQSGLKWEPVGAEVDDIQPPHNRRRWLAQLALPLRDSSSVSGRLLGVAWLFWDRSVPASIQTEIDPAWACYCAATTTFAMHTLPIYRNELNRVAENVAKQRLDTLMRHIRHDMVGIVSVILKRDIDRIARRVDTATADGLKLLANLQCRLIDLYTSFFLDRQSFHLISSERRCDLHELMARIVEYAKEISGKKVPAIEYHIAGSGDCDIPIGVHEFEMVMLNLLVNSKKYIRQNSDIHKREPVRVRLVASDGSLDFVEIDDSGAGMSEEQIEQFGRNDPIQETREGYSCKVGGAICRHLLGRFSDKLSFISPNDRRGTTVRVDFR